MGTAECTLQEQVKTLYTGHHGGLHGWLCHCLNDATDAADLAHNTFVRLVARPRSFNTGLESPACLRTVANGLCTDRQRHSEIEPAWLTLDIRPQEYAPPREAQASVLLTLHETDALLRHLPPKVDRALVLAMDRGVAHQDVARELRVFSRREPILI